MDAFAFHLRTCQLRRDAWHVNNIANEQNLGMDLNKEQHMGVKLDGMRQQTSHALEAHVTEAPWAKDDQLAINHWSPDSAGGQLSGSDTTRFVGSRKPEQSEETYESIALHTIHS
jgi:hypothetical protein